MSFRVFKRRKMFGKMSPYGWLLEPVRWCNLRCGHCATRLFELGKLEFMSKDVCEATFRLIDQVTPRCRIDMANAGEPTLHPHLYDLLGMARSLAPDVQIQVTTNGTKLMTGEVTYEQLFDAGANVVYVDMYAPRDHHVELAERSGFEFYEYYDKPPGAPSNWFYHGPLLKVIVLMKQPADWPKKKLERLGTFFNNLDWPAAEKFDLFPVTEPPERRCNQPFRYVSMSASGRYQLCCQDFMDSTKMGSVLDGLEGFKRFWFGRDMQKVRRELKDANRRAVSECSRCRAVFSQSDLIWERECLGDWWDGEKWNSFEGREPWPLF
jgi:organic radical activating enzyme